MKEVFLFDITNVENECYTVPHRINDTIKHRLHTFWM